MTTSPYSQVSQKPSRAVLETGRHSLSSTMLSFISLAGSRTCYRALCLVCLLPLTGLRAQQAPAPAPIAPATTGPVITLSPFEVNATQDTGYVGQDTLAGSRLRTSLYDLGAAISPLTEEFLADIAVTNVVDAMEFGLGTRVDTDDARQAGPVADGYNDNSARSIRIRGLPGGGRSIDFFSAPGEVDTYMTERLEVSRGPNSILFGVGATAGRIDATSKQARTDKNFYSLSHRFDSWGGQRVTADANLVALKNKVGLRAVVLRDRAESWRAAGYNDQDRFFLAGGGVLQLPSSALEFHNADAAADLQRYVQSPGVTAEDRVKLFKLVWEMVGSEFAGRHQQYEMFYAGAPFVTKNYSYLNYDFREALDLVDACLRSYGLDSKFPPTT